MVGAAVAGGSFPCALVTRFKRREDIGIDICNKRPPARHSRAAVVPRGRPAHAWELRRGDIYGVPVPSPLPGPHMPGVSRISRCRDVHRCKLAISREWIELLGCVIGSAIHTVGRRKVPFVARGDRQTPYIDYGAVFAPTVGVV